MLVLDNLTYFLTSITLPELSPWSWPRDSSAWKNLDTLFTNHCMFCTNDFTCNNLEFCPLPIKLFSCPLPSPSLRSRPPEIQLGDLGERCKFPQRGLGRSHSRNWFWCISD